MRACSPAIQGAADRNHGHPIALAARAFACLRVPPLTPPEEGNASGEARALELVIVGDGWSSLIPFLIDALLASERVALSL